MTAYVIAIINIHDRERYAEYEAGFMAIFINYGGAMLSVDEEPRLLEGEWPYTCLLYTSPSPRDLSTSRMPSSA